jgi:hypothetical protein
MAGFLLKGSGLAAERYSLRDSGRSELKDTDSFLSVEKEKKTLKIHVRLARCDGISYDIISYDDQVELE